MILPMWLYHILYMFSNIISNRYLNFKIINLTINFQFSVENKMLSLKSNASNELENIELQVACKVLLLILSHLHINNNNTIFICLNFN